MIEKFFLGQESETTLWTEGVIATDQHPTLETDSLEGLAAGAAECCPWLVPVITRRTDPGVSVLIFPYEFSPTEAALLQSVSSVELVPAALGTTQEAVRLSSSN